MNGDEINGVPIARAWPGAEVGMPPPPGYGRGPVDPSPQPRRRRIAFFVAALLLVNSAFGAWYLATAGSRSDPSTTASGQVTADKRASAIAQMVDPAVVNINTFAHGFDQPLGQVRPLGAGTGMILTSSGEILTNNHVVNGASRIDVSIAGRSGSVPATVIGVDPADDVALIKLDGVTGLPTITQADPATVSVGDRVLGIGNALGRGGTPSVAVGSISGVNLTIRAGDPGGSSEQLTGMIETNAQIQPGDSGGPLVDTNGRVVGMITAGGSANTSKSTPINGYAIPIEKAIGIVDRIRAGESSSTILLGERGHLGVSVRPLDPQTGKDLGVSAGALVVGVEPGSPAEEAGITAPAVIRSVGGRVVISRDALGPILHAYVPGDRVEVSWVDAKGVHTKTVTLDVGPAV